MVAQRPAAAGAQRELDLLVVGVETSLWMAPELAEELRASMADGLERRPGWGAMRKVRGWVEA